MREKNVLVESPRPSIAISSRNFQTLNIECGTCGNEVNAIKNYLSLVDYTIWWGFLSSLDEFFILTGFVFYLCNQWKFCCFSARVLNILFRNFSLSHFSIHNFHIFHRLLNTLNENGLNKCFDLAQWTCWHNLKYKTELESGKFARWKISRAEFSTICVCVGAPCVDFA